MRPGLFVPIKCRLAECPRLILPFAVNLKRFLAPRWVFNFNFGFDAFLGIAGNPLLTLMRCASRRVLKFELGWQLGRSMLRPYNERKILSTAIAGRWMTFVPRAWRR